MSPLASGNTCFCRSHGTRRASRMFWSVTCDRSRSLTTKTMCKVQHLGHKRLRHRSVRNNTQKSLTFSNECKDRTFRGNRHFHREPDSPKTVPESFLNSHASLHTAGTKQSKRSIWY